MKYYITGNNCDESLFVCGNNILAMEKYLHNILDNQPAKSLPIAGSS